MKKITLVEFLASDMTDHTAPTNKLLRAEIKPTDTHGPRITTTVDPVDIKDISSRVVPNQGIRYYDNEERNVDDIIDNIIKTRKTGSQTRALFKKDTNGQIRIPGLETKDQKGRMNSNETKVKEILKQSRSR